MAIKTEHVTEGAKRRLRSGGMTQGQNEGNSEKEKKKITWCFSKV